MKRKLSTIQKRENLNTVYAIGEVDVANTNSQYRIVRNISDNESTDNNYVGEIIFQRGARKDSYSTSGATNEDLLEIVRDRLIGLQNGEFSCRENAVILTHIEEALMWLNRRTEDRISRKVLGENKK